MAIGKQSISPPAPPGWAGRADASGWPDDRHHLPGLTGIGPDRGSQARRRGGMDNLPGHKVSGVRQAIEGAGGKLSHLPSYWPKFHSSGHSQRPRRCSKSRCSNCRRPTRQSHHLSQCLPTGSTHELLRQSRLRPLLRPSCSRWYL